jgi:hypothetical protein
VLIAGRNLWKLHGRWLIATTILAIAAIAITLLAAPRSGRWPGGGSPTGLLLGIIAAAIFVFELALVAKKTKLLRTARWALSAQTWMKAHIWLGLLTVPLVVLHSGGRIGGMLTTLLVSVFAIVIVSGVWGLVMQNLLPKLLLEAAPAETVYSQIDRVGRQYAAEARRLVSLACGGDDESGVSQYELTDRKLAAAATAADIHGAPRRVGLQVVRSPHPASERLTPIPSPAIIEALDRDIAEFLTTGHSAHQVLGPRQRNEWYFDDLRLRVAPDLRTLVSQLEELCERRRQLNVQRRIHLWLHNWLWLHLPLSVALMLLLAAHMVFSFRFG